VPGRLAALHRALTGPARVSRPALA